MLRIYIVFVLGILYLHFGESIKCHICLSLTDADCHENPKWLRECSSAALEEFLNRTNNITKSVVGEAFLRRSDIRQLSSSSRAGAKLVCFKAAFKNGLMLRACDEAQPDPCTLAPADVFRYCESCDRDGCNAAGHGIIDPELGLSVPLKVSTGKNIPRKPKN